MPVLAERQEGSDPESNIVGEKNGCSISSRASHYVTGEKDGKVCGVPVRVTRKEGACGDTKRVVERPVHKAIELFDKPNDIETSLPRYQNKTPILTKRCPDEEKRKALPDKMERLKEQLQQKLAARLEKCKSERDFRVRDDAKHRTVAKTESEDNKKPIPEKTKNDWKEGIENSLGKFESKDQKSEKEKQNCLLKVNLSQLNRRDSLTGSLESLKSSMATKSFELSERKCYKPLVEMNYLNKLAKKDEKTGVEYGGGWDCHRCGDRVYHAERMLACGNAYHKTCFSCVSCRKLLGPRTYLEAEMEIHCSQCHAKKFGLTGYGYGLGPGVLQTSP